MKRNGFTLIELLVVSIILAFLIIIVTTSGFGIFDKTKKSIDKIEEDNLLEAAKTYLVEIDNGLCSNLTDSECGALRNDCVDGGCILKVEDIEESGYFTDKKNKCNNEVELFLKIEVDASGKTIGYNASKADENEVICSN